MTKFTDIFDIIPEGRASSEGKLTGKPIFSEHLDRILRRGAAPFGGRGDVTKEQPP